jgi:hypothetical protein
MIEKSFLFTSLLPLFFAPMSTPTLHDLCISHILIVNLAVTMCKAFFIVIASDVVPTVATYLPVLYAHSSRLSALAQNHAPVG